MLVSDDLQGSVEAALVILVPEVEPLVSAFRLKHDPFAGMGIPAHITIDYPFLPGIDPGQQLHRELAELFVKTDAFQFAFRDLARFPDVLYLAPDPVTPFKQLIDMVAARFPESPPYGGAFDNVVPHLTIAQTEDEEMLKSIERQVARLLPEYLPLSTRAENVWLMDNRTGIWQKRNSFPLRRK